VSKSIGVETFVPATRRAQLLTLGVQPSSQKGLEFGALHNPIIRPAQGDIRFVDYTTTQGLRAHPHAESIDKSAIVDVDYVWSGSGSLATAINTGELFDYAIASHVIEHVPNIIGWFHGIADVLKPGAVFNLAIPDKRYTFDVKRKSSTLGELIEAHLLQFTHPSVRQMFDHCYGAVAVEPGAVWRNNINVELIPRMCGDFALQLAYDSALEIVKTHRYYDSHCLIVTPLSFLSLLEGLSLLKLFPFVLNDFFLTEDGEFEFFVHLEMPSKIDVLELRNRQLSALKNCKEKVIASTRLAALAADPG
jgi:hypothetical protein